MSHRAALKIGLVGCGHISTAHLRAWRKAKDCEVVGVFDMNTDLAHKQARAFDVRTVFSNLPTLVAASDVVDVCTPPQTHASIAQQVIESGRHLVIEKPLVTDLRDWHLLSRALERSRTSISVIHNIKFLHSVQSAKRWCDDGRIGKILRLERQFLTCPEADRMLTGNSHWSHQLPGGRWMETLPHELYLIYFFVGALELRHVDVLQTERATSGAPADEVVITFKGNGCIATIHFSANCAVNRRRLALLGTRGAIDVDLLSDAANLSEVSDTKWRRAVGLSLIEAGQTVVRSAPDRSRYLLGRLRGETPHAAIIRAAAAHVHGEAPPPTPVEEIAYVVENCDRIGREIDRLVGLNSNRSSS